MPLKNITVGDETDHGGQVISGSSTPHGSANSNIRNMAFDSEINVLSDAHDVASSLRRELFLRAATTTGPQKYGDMVDTLIAWVDLAKQNFRLKGKGGVMKGQLVSFHVDRKPGTPIV